MSEASSSSTPTRAPLKGRHYLLIGGLVLLIVGLAISGVLLPDVLNGIGGPQSMMLGQAAEVASDTQTYARLEDGEWDCDTLRAVRGLSASSLRYGRPRAETKYSEVFYLSQPGDVVVYVRLSGEVDCADLAEQQPTGYLYAMDADMKQTLTNDARLARYFDAESFLEFCGYCGFENSLIGAAFGLVFVLSGAGLLLLWHKTRS